MYNKLQPVSFVAGGDPIKYATKVTSPKEFSQTAEPFTTCPSPSKIKPKARSKYVTVVIQNSKVYVSQARDSKGTKERPTHRNLDNQNKQ